MDQRLKKTVQITCWVFAIVLLARNLYSYVVQSQIPTVRDMLGFIEGAISVATIFFIIYERVNAK